MTETIEELTERHQKLTYEKGWVETAILGLISEALTQNEPPSWVSTEDRFQPWLRSAQENYELLKELATFHQTDDAAQRAKLYAEYNETLRRLFACVHRHAPIDACDRETPRVRYEPSVRYK